MASACLRNAPKYREFVQRLVGLRPTPQCRTFGMYTYAKPPPRPRLPQSTLPFLYPRPSGAVVAASTALTATHHSEQQHGLYTTTSTAATWPTVPEVGKLVQTQGPALYL
ncbi:hypothetical protein LY78DRAFT_656495 [Colletotrichum sublineola]|nr:hypothetical protein LY78DRAFT_656495 [Colletotrichum sublineola]